MAEIKIRKQDLQDAKRPDAVLKGATSFFDWLLEHRTAAIGAIVVIVVIVGGVSVAQNVKHSKFAEVGGQLSSALELETRVVSAPKPEGEQKEETKGDTFATKADQEKATTEALEAVRKSHPGTPSAESAAVVLAAKRYNEGKYDEAISLAEGYITKDGSLKPFALETLGNAYVAKGDSAKAETAYKQLADVGAPALSLYLQGTLAEKAGKKDEARKLYEKVIADFEKDNAEVAKDAHTRLDLLDLPAGNSGTLEIPAAPVEPEKVPGKKQPVKKKAPAVQVPPAGK